MVLNWNIEVIVDFLLATIGIIFTIISYYSPKAKRIKSLFFMRLGFISFWIFMVIDGLSFLFLSEGLGLLSGITLIPAALFVIIGVNYTTKEHYYSFGLILIGSLAVLFIYLGTQPGAVDIELQSGYLRVRWIGLFGVFGMIFSGISLYYLFYWGIRTWNNAPFLIKKEASLFFFGILSFSLIGFIFYILYIFEPVFILFSDLAIAIGAIIILFSVLKEPKLLYILPFTIYRIVVKDRNGHPLFDHDWSESNISEKIFTGFINAVQLMSEDVMHIGGLLDINLEEGILILKESERITVGLVASKSSKLLRDSVISFTTDFEKKFNRELKSSIDDMSAYDSAYELIEKYFSNFPYKIIKSKKQPLLLSGKFLKIPLELDNKLRSVFTDEKEYEGIKAELIKSPLSIPSDFLKSYNEMLEEIKQLSGEDMKYLGSETNLDE